MTTQDQWKSFEREWAEIVVDSVNRLRTAANITVKDLAARLGEAGWPVSVATLSGILSGHKRGSISVTEWLALAWALNVQPLYLLVGFPTRARVPSSPMWAGAPDGVDTVAAWVAGDIEGFPASPRTEVRQLRRTFGGQAARNLVTHAMMMQRLRWQSGWVIALSELPSDDSWDGGSLQHDPLDTIKITLRHLAGIRAEEREVDPSWRAQFGPLPRVIEWLDDLSYAEAVRLTADLTISDLRTIATPADVAAAKESIITSRRVGEMLRAHEVNGESNGSPSDPAK